MWRRFVTITLFFLAASSSVQNFAAEWKRVYLASYPRSGNYWVRYLIEEATGVATSSVYVEADYARFLSKPFPWGGYCIDQGFEGNRRFPEKGDIVICKTHYPAVAKMEFDSKKYAKVLRIMRHPVDSIYSLHVYSYRDKPATPKMSEEELEMYIASYMRFYKYWNKKKNVLTIRYEDLLIDPVSMFARVMQKVGFKLSPEDYRRAVAKYPPQGAMLKHRDKFSEKELELINKKLADPMREFQYN